MGRIAIKIGSNVLGREDGKLNIARLAALVDQIAELHRRGFEIILISSGAVASGCGEIGVDESLDKTSARQLYSAIGQAKLINRYYDFFHEYGGKRLRVDVVQGDAYFKEGIFIDADGRATPKIENAKDKNGMRMMKIRYREGDMPQYLRTRTILSSDLIFDFVHLDDFDASQD